MGDTDLVGRRDRIVGTDKLGWRKCVPLARYALGGQGAIRATASDNERYDAISVERSHARHRQLIDEAFSLHNIRTWAQNNQRAGGMALYKLWLTERWTEESAMCTMLYKSVATLLASKGKQPHQKKAAGKLAKRYLFAHWLLRIRGSMSADRIPVYVASSVSGLMPVLELNGNHALGQCLEKALRGSAPEPKGA